MPPSHAPFALLPQLIACDVVDPGATWVVHTSRATDAMIHADSACAGPGHSTAAIAVVRLVQLLDGPTRTCPACAKGAESFGVELGGGDIAAVKILNGVSDLLTNKSVINAPVRQVASLLEHSWMTPAPQDRNIVAHHQQMLLDMPHDLDGVRSSDRYRKELLKACLLGARTVRQHAMSPPAARTGTTGMLDTLAKLDIGRAAPGDPSARSIDPDMPLDDAEGRLVNERVKPWMWVVLNRLEDNSLFGFAHDSFATASARILKVPSATVALRPPRSGYFYTLDQTATRYEVVAAHQLSGDTRPRASRPHSLDDLIVAVRAAST